MPSSRTLTRAALAAGFAFAIGCGGDSSGPAGPAVASLTLSFPGSTLSMGATQPLSAKFYDEFANEIAVSDSIAWASSNPAIASVDQSGNVHGVLLGGPVTITVSRIGISASVTLTVIPDHIVFTPADSILALNATMQLSSAAVDYYNVAIPGTGSSSGWTSSNTSVATVDSTGRLTGRGVGDAVISVTVSGRVGTRHIEVGIPGAHDGLWSGTLTPPGASVALTISISIVFDRVAFYKVVVPFPISNPLCPIPTSVVTAIPNAHITNEQFAFSIATPAANISGVFVDAATMTGTESTIALGSYTCPAGSGSTFVNRTAPGGAFTASRQP